MLCCWIAFNSFYCTSTLVSSSIGSFMCSALLCGANKLCRLLLVAVVVVPDAVVALGIGLPRFYINCRKLLVSCLTSCTLAVCVEWGVDDVVVVCEEEAAPPLILLLTSCLWSILLVKFVFANTACSVMSCYVAELVVTLIHNSFSVTLPSCALCNGS